MSIIPALRRLRQVDSKFAASLDYTVKQKGKGRRRKGKADRQAGKQKI